MGRSLAVVAGATENTVTVQALLDHLIGRGLDPTVPRLFIIDGAKALPKAIRKTFGVAAAIQRCQIHKGRNIIEGLDEILTVIRPGLSHELRYSLACTDIIENALGTVRQVSRNVKRWRNAEMARRWTAAGMKEAQKSFRRLKAYPQLPILRNALQDHMQKAQANSAVETIMKAA